MERLRESIEEFVRRYRHEENRVVQMVAVAAVLVAVGVSWASFLQTPKYEASAQVWVDQEQGAQQTNLAGTVEGLQTIILALIHAIDSRPVAEKAIQRLELENTLTPAELLDNLTIEQVESTSFMVLTYEDPDPVEAAKIVNTVGEVSSELISERSAAGSNLTANVYEEAVVPDSPVSPDPLRNGLLTLVVGLVFCAGTVVVRPRVGARVAGTLGERPSRQGVGLAGVLGRRHRDRSIVERTKEKKLLLALGRRGKLTAIEAALETSLSVEESRRILEALAVAGHLEVTVEDGKLLYSFWGEGGA